MVREIDASVSEGTQERERKKTGSKTSRQLKRHRLRNTMDQLYYALTHSNNFFRHENLKFVFVASFRPGDCTVTSIFSNMAIS